MESAILLFLCFNNYVIYYKFYMVIDKQLFLIKVLTDQMNIDFLLCSSSLADFPVLEA